MLVIVGTETKVSINETFTSKDLVTLVEQCDTENWKLLEQLARLLILKKDTKEICQHLL